MLDRCEVQLGGRIGQGVREAPTAVSKERSGLTHPGDLPSDVSQVRPSIAEHRQARAGVRRERRRDLFHFGLIGAIQTREHDIRDGR